MKTLLSPISRAYMTTSLLQQTTSLTTALNNNTNTNSTSSNTANTQPFCFSCGFNFGHIVDNMDNSTMGMILVGCTVLVIVAIASGISCYCAKKCCCVSTSKTGGYKKIDESKNSKSSDVESGSPDKDDDDKDNT
jgi:hypothetical protein